MFYYDNTYYLLIIGALLCFWASSRVKSTFLSYSKIKSQRGTPGWKAAEEILHASGIYDVQIQRVSGNLTDHYDPRSKVLRLSDSTFSSDSVAAVGVAAHECGHAIQHAKGYLPLKIRGSLVPVANFGSAAAWPLILIGLFMNGSTALFLINLGILAFSASVLFQLVTLPVEYNASGRAIKMLQETGILAPEEVRDAKRVLSAAALTYVAGAASSLLQLFRLILIGGRRRND